MATLEELLNSDIKEYLHDDIQFLIDSDLRIVTIPTNGVVAGVVGDKKINRINFQMNKMYNGFNMSEFNARVNYVNANGDVNYELITDMTVDDENLLFTWLIDSDALLYPGEIVFNVNLYKTNEDGVKTQSFFTSISEPLTVLEGMEVTDKITVEEQSDILSKLESDAKKYVLEYAKTEPLDEFKKLAEEASNVEIKKIEDASYTVTRKMFFTDETNNKKYIGEFKIINGKPILEYEELIS